MNIFEVLQFAFDILVYDNSKTYIHFISLYKNDKDMKQKWYNFKYNEGQGN